MTQQQKQQQQHQQDAEHTTWPDPGHVMTRQHYERLAREAAEQE